MRKIELNITPRGLRAFNAAREDKPNIGELGTIYTPPHRCKSDTLRTCAFQYILEDVPVKRKSTIGFTATHGCENADKGPFFFWKSGKCNNAMTINSWWHQNFILEYEENSTADDNR